MDRAFLKSIENRCVEALVDRGFESPRVGTRFIRLSKDFLGWVGLNQGNHHDFLRINPFIGIHCIPVMKLQAEMAGEKYKEGQYASYAIHMGEIAPDIDQFIFTDQNDIDSESKRLADEISKHAVPWMNANANYKSLVLRLEEKVEMLGGFPERYASALYFSGKKAAAKDFIKKRDDLFDPDCTGSYSLYDKFGKPFLAMIEKEKNVSGLQKS